MAVQVRRMHELRESVETRYLRWVAVAANGLPNWRVVTWFPALALVGVATLIILHWSGTSSGQYWYTLGTGDDPRLVLGSPKAIRSDEWLVQQSWVVSQSNTGWQDVNPTFPGGSDMTLLNELPSWHWSSLFRPHVWGYLLFGLNAGVAWHWWVPALALVSGCYLFLVTMLPRRPLTAAFLAVATYFTPLLQWFYTPSSVWPVAWALLAMAGTIWLIKDPRLWVRVTWSAVLGYLAVTMAMGLYVPFILPGLYVAVAFGLGLALRLRPWHELGWRKFMARLIPLGVAAVGALTVTLLWVWARWATVVAIQSTVYPGHRTGRTGLLLGQDPYLAKIAGAPWNEALRYRGTSILGGNSSEASSVILLCVFLLPGLLWFVMRTLRRGTRPDWLVISVVAVMALWAAYLFIPGWDSLAQAIQLGRVAPGRIRIGFVTLLPVAVALVVDHVDRFKERRHWIPGLVSAGWTAFIMYAVYSAIQAHDPGLVNQATTSLVTVPLLVLAAFLFFSRRFVAVAAASVMIASGLLTAGVNPIYQGIFDLSETEIGKEIMAVDAARDGEWVGIGRYEDMALLMQTGVGSYSGVQNYPSEEMWSEIDPESTYEELWNRLAHVQWAFGKGEPTVTGPHPDVVVVTLDPCSSFAQRDVDYVLADTPPKSLECLTELKAVKQGIFTFHIYEVVPPA